MDETIYPFDQEKIEEMARLSKQAGVLDNLISLPGAAQAHAGGEYRVLDLGCGPGSWSMSVAQRFPRWQVRGLDLSERMIGYARVQAQANKIENVEFQVGNALDPLPFADGSLDFIHTRLLHCFMPFDAWIGLLTECRRVLRPGGYVQMVEHERPVCNKAATTRFGAMVAEMCVQLGVSGSPDGQSFGICNMLAYFLLQAGFAIEEERAYSVNYSAWSPVHGVWGENIIAALKQYPEILARQGKPKEETEQLCRQAIQEMNEPDFCALFFFLGVVARKPE